jgi:hypothetical protein
VGVIATIHGARLQWPDILRDAPPEHVHPRRDGWVLARENHASTGLQLGANGADLIVRLPYFCGIEELEHASRLVPAVVEVAGGTLAIEGTPVPPEHYPQVLGEHLAPPLIDASMAEIPKLLAAPNTAFNVEGWRRPYFLGAHILQQLVGQFPQEELYERLIGLIVAMQAYPEDRVSEVKTIELNGRRYRQATWHVATERMIPPCDVVAIDDGSEKLHVPAESLADVLPPHGIRLDEFSWLAMPPPRQDLEALIERAEAAAVTRF